MTIKGTFDDITLPDVFQIISIGKRSGKLVVSAGSKRAFIIFDKGHIVQASIDGYTKNIGRLLLQRGFISKAKIQEALHIQSEMDEWKQIGAICLEKGFISKVQLEEAVKTLISEIIMELLGWQDGTMSFEAGESTIDDDIVLDMRELILRSGISSDSILMEGARMLDEKDHYRKLGSLVPDEEDEAEKAIREERKKKIKDGWITSFARGVLEDIDVSFFDEFVEDEEVSKVKKAKKKLAGAGKIYAETKILKDVLRQSDEEQMLQEFSFTLMKFASEIAGRVLLFYIRDKKACGVGHMGFTSGIHSMNELIRDLKIPLDEESVLTEAYKNKEVYCGNAPETKWNSYLLNTVGLDTGKEVMVVPITMEDDVRMLLYADNHPLEEPLKNYDDMEAFVYQASMAFEIAVLEKSLAKRQISDNN